MQNEKIIVLGAGRGVTGVISEIMRSEIDGADFAFMDMNDYDDCEKIIKEKFSGTDIMFVIANANESDELSLAVNIAKNAKSNGIFTIGIAARSGGINEFSDFVNSFVSPFDAVFFLNAYLSSQKKTYLKIIECISDLITKSGYVNIDFADVKEILQDSGRCAFGEGYFAGSDRALNAAREAVHDMNIESAEKFLVNITTGSKVDLGELYDAASVIGDSANPDAQVVLGHVIDENLNDGLRVSLIAVYPKSYKEV